MQKLLEGASSAEEALLKCAAHFNVSAKSKEVLTSLEDIIEHRKEEKTELERAMVSSVADAIRQQNRIEKEQPGWSSLNKQEKGEILNPLNR